MKHRPLLALTAVLSWGGGAMAVESSVGLRLRDCPELDEHALREHLELELVTLKLEQSRAVLSVRCEQGAANIDLERAPDDRYPIQVRVELRDTARAARERLVALAATELLAQAERARVAEAKNDARPRPLVTPAPAPVAVDAAEPARTPRGRRVELFVAGSVALDGAPKTTLWGGSLGTLLGLGPRWSLLFDTRFEQGVARQSLVDVRWSLLSAFAGATARFERGAMAFAVGGGVRAGWLALDATAREPHEAGSLTAPWAGLALPLRLSAQLGARVVPFAGFEAGYVILPVRGNSKQAAEPSREAVLIEQSGPWFSCSAGLGVVL